MADAVGAVASVLQLVSATAKLIQYCIDVAHAPEEVDRLVVECMALNPVLMRLKNDAKFQNTQAAEPLRKPLDDMKNRVENLATKLRPQGHLRKITQNMMWPLLKKDMKEVVEGSIQLTSLINSWMTLDVKDAVNSIKEDTVVLPDMMKKLQKTMSMTVQNEIRQTREILNTIMNYFSPVSFSEKQNEISGQRHPDTGKWFIDSPTFQEWIRSPGATLWCPGAPGSGKTFISSIAVDYLETMVKKEGETGLTYVYCDFRHRIQEPTTLLASLWTQLMLQRETSKAEVDQLSNDLYARRVKLTATQINGLVEKEFTDGKFQRMFVVIDALDECTEAQRDILLDHVSRLHPWANVLITSRVLGSDLERFTDVRILRIGAIKADLRAYIKSRITSSRKLAENVKRKQELESEIVRIVSERAQELFLLCRLHMDSLALESTPKAVRKVLEAIPRGDTAMRETYNNAVQRIESQHQTNRDWAIRTIQWVCFAMRPLTSTELTHALAVDQDDTELSKDDIISTDLLVEYCGGLVVIEPDSEIVKFVHFTTQEYFEAEKNTALFAGTDGNIALACITFLSFDDQFLNDDATLPNIRDVHNKTPFLEYAAVHFGKHYHKMLSLPDSKDTALAQDIFDAMGEFFKSAVKVHRAAVSALHTTLGKWQVWPGGHHPVGNLNVSAIDLGAFYNVILPNDTDADDSLDLGDTLLTIRWFKRHTKQLTGENRQSFGNALHWAALGDSVRSMDLLVQDPSLDLDTKETNTWAVQPAHVSAVFGSVGTLRTLLEHSELNVTSRIGDHINWTGTILHLAIRSVGSTPAARRIAMIDTIVEKDVHGKLILGHDIYAANALVLAVKESEYLVFQRVLRYFDAVAGNSIWKNRLTADRFSKTPLHWAVMDPSFGFKNRTVPPDSGPRLKLQALLDHPLAWELMCMRDNKNDRPFEEAVRQSNIHAVEYMITKAAEHQWPVIDQLVMPGLYLAVEVAHWTVVELLLSKVGPKLLARPNQDTTVLHHAASGTSHGAMKFLLQKLETVGLHNIRDRLKMTPLHVAALTGNLDAVDALLELDDIEINAKDQDDDTPLHLAAMHDIGDACSRLLAAGSSSSTENARGLTPLAVALERRASSAVQAILISSNISEKPWGKLDDATASWVESQPWGQHLLDENTANSASSLQYWPQDEKDIIQAALCLRRKLHSANHPSKNLPAQTQQRQDALPARILDLANYWIKTTSTRVAVTRMQMLRQWHHPTLPFITSRPVRGPTASPARRVVFSILAHDQGYSDNPGAGNWTWFVAEAAQGAVFGPGETTLLRGRGGTMTFGGGKPAAQGPVEICRNQLASRQWVPHTVVWDVAGDAEAAWVRALRPGNVVLVRPMVMFPGWENWVRRVTIDVYTSCLKDCEESLDI
ncbi:hypothetical protein GGS24DRAFT_461484 [Hypoxylon argillaceum]|nr:hypothetical protein GGS24DRAFT_461484 [Hypoxylon argillaceum]